MIDNISNHANAAASAQNLGVVRHTPFGDLIENPTIANQPNFASLFGEVTSAANAGAVSSASSTVAAAAATIPAGGSAASSSAASSSFKPGIEALVNAMMNGTFQASYVTDPTKLQEVTPIGITHMSSMFYASDQTAQQLAQLLGGKVVQKPAFAVSSGWQDPNANFIELPSGQTVNAADLAYYARCTNYGAGQLYADLTADINQGAASSDYNDSMQSFFNGSGENPGEFAGFDLGAVGPAIAGMSVPDGMLNGDGTVVNPAMADTPIIKT